MILFQRIDSKRGVILAITYLKLPVVKLVTILKKKLICRSKACLDAVLDHGAGSGRAAQLLDLEQKGESYNKYTLFQMQGILVRQNKGSDIFRTISTTDGFMVSIRIVLLVIYPQIRLNEHCQS